MKKVLIVDNNDSFVYNLLEILRKLNLCEYTLQKASEIEIEKAALYDGFLLSPGPGLPKESPGMRNLIERYYADKAFLGICLGHQALAEHFGAQLRHFEQPKHGYQSRLIYENKVQDVLFKNIPEHSCIGRYHSWYLDSDHFPRELIVSARDEEKNIMAFFHPAYPLHGLQFHPESILTEYGTEMIGNWIDIL